MVNEIKTAEEFNMSYNHASSICIPLFQAGKVRREGWLLWHQYS